MFLCRSTRSGSLSNKENKVKYNVDGYLLPMTPKGTCLSIVLFFGLLSSEKLVKSRTKNKINS